GSQPQGQNLRREHERRQQSVKGSTERRNGQHGEPKSKESPDKGDGQRFGQHKEENGAITKTYGFEYREFGNTLTNRNSHSVAGNQQKRKKDHAADGHDKKLDVPELLDPTGSKRGLRLCFGFERRIGKHVVNGFRDTDGVVRAFELENIPTNVPFKALRHAFFEIIPLEPELTFVSPDAFAVIDAVEIELPDITRPEQRIL